MISADGARITVERTLRKRLIALIVCVHLTLMFLVKAEIMNPPILIAVFHSRVDFDISQMRGTTNSKRKSEITPLCFLRYDNSSILKKTKP